MRSLARVVALVSVLLGVATMAQAQEVTLSVAISMKEAVEELGKGFMASRPGVTLRYNFGSSGELQKQIEAGAPIDLFISAAQRQMDELEQKRLVVAPPAGSSRATCSPSSSRRIRRSTSPSRPTCSTHGSRRSSSATPRRCRPASTPRRASRRSGWGRSCSPSSSSRRTSDRRSTTGSRRGRRRLRLHDRRGHPRPAGEGGVPAGGRYVSARAVSGGGRHRRQAGDARPGFPRSPREPGGPGDARSSRIPASARRRTVRAVPRR